MYKQAANVLPKEYAELGALVSIDGSLVDAALSMYSQIRLKSLSVLWETKWKGGHGSTRFEWRQYKGKL